ncbi:MAG: potassium transporter Kup [Candidatus Sericytochromatia bacterium]|nr:potassium transporter Kup [Candidatus Sericytochromatia bacterium]
MSNRLHAGTAELPPPPPPKGRYLATLTLAALGIVYGDLGTSPLYAVRESFLPEHGVAVTPENILGVLSLIVWALILIISVKYIVFVLRADNQGEGGILALTSLVLPNSSPPQGRYRLLMLLGLFGTALVYGDGMITPAISVLSAVEGLGVATPFFEPYIVPITIVILVILFMFQRRGTAQIGRVFGPVMVVWFLVLAGLGILNILKAPMVFGAFNPYHAVTFFLANGWHGFVVLGSVFLVLTGGEALYADMGHFGRRPITLAWFALVLPALLINYFGQGALLIVDPAAAANPFFRMAPAWALYPLVGLSAVAAVIASQALISGAFSLTMQAIQLGYAPRTQIDHTSASEIGQIYIPGINMGLMLACIGLVLGFGSSSKLAAAYGVAVTLTMAVTTILFYVVMREKWHWNLPLSLLVAGGFLAIDVAFMGANLLKVFHGGWFPLVIGAAVFTLLTTWKKGRRILAQRVSERTQPLTDLFRRLEADPPVRVAGTAVFMYSQADSTPPALMHNLRHNGVLHKRVFFLSVKTRRVPFVPLEERSIVEPLGQGIFQIKLQYGFMEAVNVPEALAALNRHDLPLDPATLIYFLGRETVLASNRPGMAIWRERLFSVMSSNARSAASFFCLPPDQVVELGAQIEI